MEESERPSKLRKLSHPDVPTAEINGTASQLNKTSSAIEDVASNAPAARDKLHPSESIEEVEADSQAVEPESSNVEGAQILSKNQLKKLRKKEAWEAGRDDRKLKRKEKDREKKQRKKAAIKEAVADGREHEIGKIQHPDRRPRPKRRTTLPVAFMLDCGFDEYMLERESISLGTQITRSYSEYMKSPYQPHLIVSGWTAKNVNRERFEGLLKGMYKNWTGVVFTEEDFVGAGLIVEKNMRDRKGGRMVAAFEKYAPPKAGVQQDEIQTDEPSSEATPETEQNGDHQVNSSSLTNGNQPTSDDQQQKVESSPAISEHFKALQDQGEIIYLTSDSPNTLNELKPYHTYIIGGIVDKNRHKGLCYKRALDANSDPAVIERLNGRKVSTAKLPIGEYMQMASRQVLATNHVVEIMLRWLECRDWGQAFLEVMPKRKGAKLREGSTDDQEALEEESEQDTPQDGDGTDNAAHTCLE